MPVRETITFEPGKGHYLLSIPICSCPLPDDEDELEFAIDLGSDSEDYNDTVTIHIYR